MLLEAEEPQASQKQAPVKAGQHHGRRRYIMTKKPHRTPNPCVSCFTNFPAPRPVNLAKNAATHMPGLRRPNTRRFGTLTTDFEEKIVVLA